MLNNLAFFSSFFPLIFAMSQKVRSTALKLSVSKTFSNLKVCCLQNGEDSNNNFVELFFISKPTIELECKQPERLVGTEKTFTLKNWGGGAEDKLLMMKLTHILLVIYLMSLPDRPSFI